MTILSKFSKIALKIESITCNIDVRYIISIYIHTECRFDVVCSLDAQGNRISRLGDARFIVVFSTDEEVPRCSSSRVGSVPIVSRNRLHPRFNEQIIITDFDIRSIRIAHIAINNRFQAVSIGRHRVSFAIYRRVIASSISASIPSCTDFGFNRVSRSTSNIHRTSTIVISIFQSGSRDWHRLRIRLTVFAQEYKSRLSIVITVFTIIPFRNSIVDNASILTRTRLHFSIRTRHSHIDCIRVLNDLRTKLALFVFDSLTDLIVGHGDLSHCPTVFIFHTQGNRISRLGDARFIVVFSTDEEVPRCSSSRVGSVPIVSRNRLHPRFNEQIIITDFDIRSIRIGTKFTALECYFKVTCLSLSRCINITR